MQESAVVLASGKNLEQYLGRLRAALDGVEVVEVGRTIPSLWVAAGAGGHGGGAGHAADVGEDEAVAGAVDPHWWDNVDNMRRAARVVAVVFAGKDPAGKDDYLSRAMAYGQRLEELKKWADKELGKIPRGQRKLVTAHNAFGYFAKEFGFEVIAVAGLNSEQNTTPRELAETIETVQHAGVRAVFPEARVNGKTLDSIAAATGARIATPLIGDGNGTGNDAGFEAMIRHNVKAITQALAPP